MSLELFQTGHLLRLCHAVLGKYALVKRSTPHYLHVITSRGAREALKKADVAPVQIFGRLVLHGAERTYQDQVWRDLEFHHYTGESRPLAYCAQASLLSAKVTQDWQILVDVFLRGWGEATPPRGNTSTEGGVYS